jgi:hypothetical protein
VRSGRHSARSVSAPRVRSFLQSWLRTRTCVSLSFFASQATAGETADQHPLCRSTRVFAALLVGLSLLEGCKSPCPPDTFHRADLCIRPRDAGDADRGISCEAGLVLSAGACVSEKLYVSVSRGSDHNEGSDGSPFKTFHKAMTVALKGQTVYFDAGEYSAQSGDDFSQPIPDGVTLEQRSPSSGAVIFRADGLESLVFLGSGKLLAAEAGGMHLDNFLSPLRAASGTQSVANVEFNGSQREWMLSGTARVDCTRCYLRQRTPETNNMNTVSQDFVSVHDRAMLTLIDSVLEVLPNQTGRVVDCYRGFGGVAASNSATVVLDHTIMQGAFLAPIRVHDTAAARILRGTRITAGCVGDSLNIAGPSSADGGTTGPDVTIEDSRFSGTVSVRFAVQRFTVRRSSFAGSNGSTLLIAGSGGSSFDLGRPDDPGLNTFVSGTGAVGVLVQGAGYFIQGHGNTWRPNVQGADAEGRYPPGTTFVGTDGGSVIGENVTILEATPATPSQVQL